VQLQYHNLKYIAFITKKKGQNINVALNDEIEKGKEITGITGETKIEEELTERERKEKEEKEQKKAEKKSSCRTKKS